MNVKAVVEAAGFKVSDIIKTTVFVKDLNDFGKVNAVYQKFFDEFQAPYPARSCVEVARLPKDAGVEIEAIAYRQWCVCYKQRRVSWERREASQLALEHVEKRWS